MSRTPVREALRRLEAEGLIVHEQRRGLVIAQLDHQMVMELYATRETLEGMAARMTARYASDGEVAFLQQMLDEEAGMQADPGALRDHNETFHEEIFRCSHNRYLLQAAGSLQNTTLLLVNTTFALEDRPQSALQEHGAIVDAITRREPERAEAAARLHIQISLKCRLRLMGVDRKSRAS